MARVLLGVTGGIAAYKACELCRLLVKEGHDVVPLVTPGAERFVTAETFRALARRPPRDDVFAAITARAGRTFWLNPEPRLYWNYGDSVIAAYERHCTAFECWRTDQLEEFVKVLSR